MATVPLIFPSLSRQPSMDSSKTIEDDTIRDQMESGYQATRPRFTRVRRTWKLNVRNLQREDVRALDEFVMVTAARGGNAFLYPNLLHNWSFEFPALSAQDLVFGWGITTAEPQTAIGINTSTVEDGTQSISFSTVAGQSIPATTTITAQISAYSPIPCAAGEVYQLVASVNAVQGTLAAGVLSGTLSAAFFDVNGNALSTQTVAVVIGGGWQSLGLQATAPANASTFLVQLNALLANTTASAIALDGSSSIAWDAIGCALLTPLTKYGRMVGSQPLGCFVRFSKLPDVSDIGFGDGVKRYGANFELTEV
jgi:hypothetical protein